MACFFLLKKHFRIGVIGFLLVFNNISYTVFFGTVVISNKIKKMKMKKRIKKETYLNLRNDLKEIKSLKILNVTIE